MKEQIFFVSGGLSFRDRKQALEYFQNKNIDEVWPDKSWRKWLFWTLEESYEMINVDMPGKDVADYQIWKVFFEKYLAKINSEKLILIGYSLGTIFILKYLTENSFPKKIKQLHLVAPIVSNQFQPVNDPEDTGTFTFDISQVGKVEHMCENIFVWHSKDDSMCDFKNSEFLQKEIPKITLNVFENKGHFFQSTFLELFDVLRK